MQKPLAFGQLRVRVGKAPPVYDPGGDTWAIAGDGPSSDFEAVELAAVAAGAAQLVVPRGSSETLGPLGFSPMSDFWRGELMGRGRAPDATEHALSFMLDLAEARRAAYAEVQPVFWRAAGEARPNQARWFRHLLAEESTRVLKSACGFLIASSRGGAWAVDDFCVVSAADWDSAGRRLLTTLEGEVEVVCACHDRPKQVLMRQLGLEPSHTWFQKTLRGA